MTSDIQKMPAASVVFASRSHLCNVPWDPVWTDTGIANADPLFVRKSIDIGGFPSFQTTGMSSLLTQ